jgi:hypothetical protein
VYTISGKIASDATVKTYSYTVTPTNTSTGCAATTTASVQITVNAAKTTPTYAKSEQTWKIGNYTWSDLIVVTGSLSGCTSTSSMGTNFSTSYYYTTGGVTYFQQPCVLSTAATLCDNGWSYPSESELLSLCSSISYAAMSANWEGWGLWCQDAISFPDEYGQWVSVNQVAWFRMNRSGCAIQNAASCGPYGMPVRCIKN